MIRQLALGNCSEGPPRNGRVNYSSGLVKWGESPYQSNPGWGGAGTNGGANVIILSASCAQMSNRPQEVWPAFAGLPLLFATMPHTGDMANSAERGGQFAARYQANPWGSMADAWVDTMWSLSDRNTWCRSRGGVSYGGGFGYNGCGAQAATSAGDSSTDALARLNQEWRIALYDMSTKSIAYSYTRYACNYDCATWTFALP